MTGLATSAESRHIARMRGRMVRVSGTQRADAVMYAVAEPDPFLALEIVRAQIAKEGQYVEDLGRVEDELISALKLAPGEFKQI